MTRAIRSSLVRLLVLWPLVAACSGEYSGNENPGLPPGTQYLLTIVGDRNVALDGGAQVTLAVKYHEPNGAPIAGQITFRLDGSFEDSSISATQMVTDPTGTAQVILTGGSRGQTFRVIATADKAAPAEWQVALRVQNLPPLAAIGTYHLDSQFDLVSGLPGAAGDVVNAFVALTDGPNDPASYLLDQIGGTAGDAIDVVRPAIDVVVNQILLAYAPDFVTVILEIGDQFGDLTKRFGLVSELTISQGEAPGAGDSPRTGLTARHSVIGIHFTVNATRYEYTVAELGWAPVVAENVGVTMDPAGKLVVAEHTLPLSYGSMLVWALNHILIPELSPGSANMGQVIAKFVDCGILGEEIASYLGLGFPLNLAFDAAFSSACDDLAGDVGRRIEDQIRGIGGAEGTALVIHGDAIGRDMNGDMQLDKLVNGLWEGSLTFGSSLESDLARPLQRFIGDRMAR